MAIRIRPTGQQSPPGAIKDLAQLGRLFDREQMNPQLSGQQETTVLQQPAPLPENSILGVRPSMAVLDDFHVDDVKVLPDSDTVHVIMHSGRIEPAPEQQQPAQTQTSFSFNAFSTKDTTMTTATANTATASINAAAAAPAVVTPNELLQRALAGDAAAAAEIAEIAEKAKASLANVPAQAVPDVASVNKIDDLDVFDCKAFVPEDARESSLGKAFAKLETITAQTQSNFKAVGNRLSGVEARLAALESAPKHLNLRKPELSFEDRVADLGWQAATGVMLGAGVTAGCMLIGALVSGFNATDAAPTTEA